MGIGGIDEISRRWRRRQDVVAEVDIVAVTASHQHRGFGIVSICAGRALACGGRAGMVALGMFRQDQVAESGAERLHVQHVRRLRQAAIDQDRQYLPRRMDFSPITNDFLRWVEYRLNTRPARRYHSTPLGYLCRGIQPSLLRIGVELMVLIS